MKLETRIKLIALALVLSPTKAISATSINELGPTAGIPVSPPVLFANAAETILNIALLPLAAITLIFFLLSKRKYKKTSDTPGRLLLLTKISLTITLFALAARLALPALENWVQNTYFF